MNDDIDVTIDAEDESLEGEGSSAVKLDRKIKTLREQLEKAQKERQEYLDGWQRAKADYVNVKRRAEDERVFFVRSASMEIVKSLLPVLDSFDHALEAEQGTPAWAEGIKNTHSQLLKALEVEGVESFDPVGEIFDPLRHEPVETVAVKNEKEDNMVTKTHQKGYTLHDVVVRPARVTVAHYKG